MLEVAKNDRFEQFILSLADADIISLEADNRVIINDTKQFLEFGFGLYLLWIHIHKRQKIPLLYFTEIPSDYTFFLVSPSIENPYFIAPKGYERGKFYLDSIEKCYLKNPSNCLFCDIPSSLLFNISYFKNTNAFSSFLTSRNLGKLTRTFPKPKKGKCPSCSADYFDWIKSQISADDRYGLMLGGYPAILKTPVRIYDLLFTEPIELSDAEKVTGFFFDAFLCIWIANKFGSKTYFANSRLKSPFSSYEIDIGVLIERDANTFLVIETTSYFHQYESLKNKVLTYMALRESYKDNFLYIYLTLRQGISARFGPKRVETITNDHSELGTFASIFTNNDDLELLSLPETYKDMDINIRNDWWDKKYLRNSYDYLIDKIEDLTDKYKEPE